MVPKIINMKIANEIINQLINHHVKKELTLEQKVKLLLFSCSATNTYPQKVKNVKFLITAE